MIERLNQDCFCLTLDTHRLQQVLQQALPESIDLFGPQHAHLFSAQPVFISQTHAQRMREVAQAIERVAALDAFRERVLAYAPAAARQAQPGRAQRPKGVTRARSRRRHSRTAVCTRAAYRNRQC